MAFYIKVKPEVADYMNLTSIRNRTADGNVLLWQADIARFQGDTVFDRANYVGGACLSPIDAKGETDGVDNPVEVTVPEWLAPKVEVPSVDGEVTFGDEAVVEETEEKEGGEV